MKDCKPLVAVFALIAMFLFGGGYLATSQAGTLILQKVSFPEPDPEPIPDPAPPGTSRVHGFTGLPLTADGWTDFSAMIQNGYKNARVIFVSNSGGNDSTGQIYSISDLTFDQYGTFQPKGNINPYRTIAAGYAQIRDGYPDILLLKRGDTWAERFSSGSIGNWSKSGPSALERIIFGAYGAGSRPTLNIGANTGFSSNSARNLIVSGLHLKSTVGELDQAYRGGGISLGGSVADHLYEDCYLNWTTQSTLQGSASNPLKRIAVRRSIFDETRMFYATRLMDLLVEESIFYKPVQKGRHLYLSPAGNEDSSTLRGVIVRRNIFFESNEGALHFRGGGIANNNLIVRNDELSFGGKGGSSGSIQSGEVRNNIFTEHINGYSGAALGITNIVGGVFADNIFTDQGTKSTVSTRAINMGGDAELGVAKDIDIYGNIAYGWATPGSTNVTFSANELILEAENVNIHNNDWQMVTGASNIIRHTSGLGFKEFNYNNNRYYSTNAESTWFNGYSSMAAWVAVSGETGAQAIKVDYPAPHRTLKTYNQEILGGAASIEVFMANTLKQARSNWSQAYTACEVNNYIRKGFDKKPVDCNF
jgi:hypothetical protein